MFLLTLIVVLLTFLAGMPLDERPVTWKMWTRRNYISGVHQGFQSSDAYRRMRGGADVEWVSAGGIRRQQGREQSRDLDGRLGEGKVGGFVWRRPNNSHAIHCALPPLRSHTLLTRPPFATTAYAPISSPPLPFSHRLELDLWALAITTETPRMYPSPGCSTFYFLQCPI
jgi:hypothetical protein